MNKVLSCVAGAILCVSALGAQEGVLDRGMPRNAMGALTEYLNLSSEQAAELQTLQARFAEEIKGIQQQIQDKRARIKAELQSEFPNANLIGQLLIEIKQLNETKKTIKAEFNTPALAVLNPEQIRLLGPLKVALRLIRSARQAVHFNLILWNSPDQDSADSLF